MKPRHYFVLLLSVFLFFGCDNLPFLQKSSKKSVSRGQPPAGAVVVAQVGGFYVTSDDLDKEVEGYNNLVTQQGMPQNKIDTREKKVQYLRNELVRKYIIYQEALDRGLDKRRDIMATLENAKTSFLVTELLREEVEKVNVTSKEVEDFYDQNKNALREPEQRRISEIVLPTEAEAKEVYIELLKEGSFSALAKQYSKASTAANGGDLGFIIVDPDPKKRIKPDKFYEVAFTLEQGAISSIFKGTDGYYIIKVDSIKKPEVKSLSELSDNIKNWLLFEKQQKAVADLATKLTGETKISIYEGKVN